MILCEICNSDNAPDFRVSYDFEKGKYCCPPHHGRHVTFNPRVGIKRMLVTRQISSGTENHIVDRCLSPEDGQTLISRSTGREWRWQGE